MRGRTRLTSADHTSGNGSSFRGVRGGLALCHLSAGHSLALIAHLANFGRSPRAIFLGNSCYRRRRRRRGRAGWSIADGYSSVIDRRDKGFKRSMDSLTLIRSRSRRCQHQNRYSQVRLLSPAPCRAGPLPLPPAQS